MPFPRSRSVLALISVAAALALGWCSGAGAASPPAAVSSAPLRQAMQAAINKVEPALVRLHVVSASFAQGREIREEEYGSGVIISDDGYVITNHHVAGNAVMISCTLADREEMDARLVGTDALADIAVVKLCPPTPRHFHFASFGDSDTLHVGDRVFAMGSPLAFSQSVTMGVISNTELVMPQAFGDDAMTLDGEDVGSIVRWVAHDAKIFPGNSGGPLVDESGKIIGLNEISVGLSGAIPGNLAHSVAEKLILYGKVTRAWLGLAVQPLLKSSAVQQGVMVADTAAGSPAAEAGFHAGDILTRVAQQPVDVHFQEELPIFNQMIMSLPIGKPITASVLRDGKTLTLTVTPRERQKAQEHSRELKSWGLTACTASRPTVNSGETGVQVTSVREGSPADRAKPALTTDDLLTAVEGQPVATVADLATLTEKLLAGKTGLLPVMVNFTRGTEHYLTIVNIGLEGPADTGRDAHKAWLPVGMQVLTNDMAHALGIDGTTGMRITRVYPHTNAETAGLQVGDIITGVDAQTVDASQPEDADVLPQMLRQYKIGSVVQLAIIRGHDKKTLAVTLPETPKSPSELAKYYNEDYDFSVRDMAFADRMHADIPAEQQGVVVESVGEGGWAALGRLRPGDVITTVAGTPVTTTEGLAATMRTLTATRPTQLIMQVLRDKHTQFLELQGSWQAVEHAK